MLDQEIYVQPKSAQGEHYKALQYVQVSTLKGQSRFLMCPEKKGLEESWVMERDAQVCSWRPSVGALGRRYFTGCCAAAAGLWEVGWP